MRNDRAAYIAVSTDGLHFGEPRNCSGFVAFPESRQDRSCFPAVKHFRNF
jgi:hypothetical protein